MAAKKNKKNISPTPDPMPSLIFHESGTHTPNADQIEKELLHPPGPPSLDHLKNYSHKAHRMLWIAVGSITAIICGLWAWSIYSQLSVIKMKMAEEKNFVENTRDSWTKAFDKTNQKQLEDIKENITKILSGSAGMASSTTSTPTTTTTP